MDEALMSLLREMAQELTDCRRYLGRLVAMEEERREGERQIETLSESLLPSNAEPVVDLDWYRDSRGNFVERGTHRLLTPEEIEIVTYSPRRRAS